MTARGEGAKVNVGQYKVMNSKISDQIMFKREIEIQKKVRWLLRDQP